MNTEKTDDGAANRTSSSLTNDELGSKRISFNDGTDSSVQPSSKPVQKKRLLKSGNHVDTSVPSIITSPEINDVLLGKGSDCFNHIGNRRYRILVEINVENYFDSDVTPVKVEDTVGNANTVSAKQDKIIKSIISSIQGNSPSGRFLLPNVVRGGKVTNNMDVILWKVASREEVRRKIHLTFLAAGRFFVKKADIVVEIERRASQVLTESTTDEESRDDSAMQQERRASLGQHAEEDNSEHSTEDSADDTAKRGASQEVDAGAGRSAAEQDSNSSRNKPSPSTMNLQEGIPLSRQLYDRQMLLSRSSGQAMNYIPRTVKSFIAIPVEEFFMPDERLAASSAEVIPHPAAYIMPSNYDVLCGAGQSFFHHIGNRRFRIMIEMNIDRYQVEYEKGDGGEKGKIHALVSEINQSILRCDPPGRFLAMDMTRGWWKRLSPMFALLKIEQTLFECMQIKRRTEQNMLAAKQKEQLVMAIEAATRSTLQRHAQEDLLEAAKQKEELERAIDIAGKTVQQGSYIPAKRKKKQESRSSTLTREQANIFFPPVFGDEEKLTKAQEEAKRTLCNSRSRDDPPSITNKPVPPFTTSPTPTTSPSKINLSENESTNDSQVVSEEERKSEQSHISHDRSVLDAVGGMLEISRRGSSSQS